MNAAIRERLIGFSCGPCRTEIGSDEERESWSFFRNLRGGALARRLEQGAHVFRREAHILRFLKDERCSVRIVEVRLFKTSRLSERVPMDTRRWKPGGDLTETAKEISKYIVDSGSADATIVASDEL